MLNRNRLSTGLIIGLLLPAIVFLMLFQVFSLLEKGGAASGTGLSEDFRERTLAIVALAVNVFPMRIFQRRRWEDAIRGIVVATAALAIGWVIFFGKNLF